MKSGYKLIMYLATFLLKVPIKLIFLREIEDITWPRGDTNFIFECRKNLTSERSERVRFFQHEKIKFVSPSGICVADTLFISPLYYLNIGLSI